MLSVCQSRDFVLDQIKLQSESLKRDLKLRYQTDLLVCLFMFGSEISSTLLLEPLTIHTGPGIRSHDL